MLIISLSKEEVISLYGLHNLVQIIISCIPMIFICLLTLARVFLIACVQVLYKPYL